MAAVLTAVMAGPVWLAPTARLFGSEIVGRHADPFIVINQFEHPSRPNLYTQAATDYVGAAIAAITGDGVLAYNLLVLATFPLAALFAYLLALRLTGSRPASWLAGLLYAFAPFHVAQSAYHPHGAQIQWLPLYLLALWLCLERSEIRRLLLLFASLALVALSNFYYGLMAAVITPFALAGFWLVHRHREGGSTRGLRGTLLALAALAVVGLAYIAAFAPAVFERRESLAFAREELALYGAHPSSYLTPPLEHPVFGAWVREIWNRRGGDVLEQQITLGLGLALLAALAVVLYFRAARPRESDATPALVLIAAAAFVFSLAPSADGSSSWLRPATLVYEVLPMFRAYARFGLVVFLALAILAAVGVTWLLRRERGQSRRAERGLGVALLALVLVELAPFPPFRWRDVLPTSAHRFLNDLPDLPDLNKDERPVRVLDCASPTRFSEQPVFQRFAHQISLPERNADCGDPDYPVKLSRADFTHLLVRRESTLGGWLATRAAPPGTVRVGRFPDALLYELKSPSEPRPYLEFRRGFHWREYRDNETYRWMGARGELTVVNPGPAPVLLRLELELHAFPSVRTLRVVLDDSPIAELSIASEPGGHGLPEVRLTPGRHSLTLQSLSPATVADAVLHNGDLRELTVALWDWTATAEPLAVSSPGTATVD